MGKVLFGVMLVKAPRAVSTVTVSVIGLLALGLAGFSEAAALIGGVALTVLFVGVALAFLIAIGGSLVRVLQAIVLTTLGIAVAMKRRSRRRIDNAAF
ncbi:lysylphosphatidylglycerol synthetase-like protein (DUF2156 family) [Skermanella aerolata]|uniref:hypothetical protein n=1 Tax=Skermanella aerolata TaxID=393310 RepID=UPI003D1C10F5